MPRPTQRSGFTIIEIVLVVAVLAIMGFVGYIFYNNYIAKTDSTSQSATATDVKTAPEIKSTSDLDKAATVLDQTDPGTADDAAQLDSETANF